MSDNASTDGTPDAVREFLADPRFRYHRNDRNLGMVGNWRRGVRELATGEWVMILSDDDHLTRTDYVRNALRRAAEDPGVVLVLGNAHIRLEPGEKMIELRLPWNPIEDGRRVFLGRGTVFPQDFALCNVLFRRDLALELDAFSNDHCLFCDSELFLKMCLRGKVGVVHEFVSVYRVHADNLTSASRKDWRPIVHNLDALLAPLGLARSQRRIAEPELAAWERRLVLPAIQSSLLVLASEHRDSFARASAALHEKAGPLFETACASRRFRAKLSLARHCPPLYAMGSRVEAAVGRARARPRIPQPPR